MLSGRLYVRPLTHISHDAIFSSVTGAISILLDINIHHVNGNCWKGFKVRGQKSRPQRGQVHFLDTGIATNLLPSVRCTSGGGTYRATVLRQGFRRHEWIFFLTSSLTCTGCEFGDRDETCSSISASNRVLCYSRSGTCCATCRTLHNTNIRQ